MVLRMTLALAVLLATGGCDSAGTSDYDGVLEVSLAQLPGEPVPALLLATAQSVGCGRRVEASVERRALVRRVVVEGIGRDNECDAHQPATAIVDLGLGPELPSGYALEVEHAGATDLYELDLGNGLPTLTAVRTSTTRLGR